MKKQLFRFDFHNFSEGDITKDSLRQWRKDAVWLLPQLLSFLGSECKLSRNENGLFSPSAFIQDNLELCRQDKLLYEGTPVPEAVFIGMLRILTHYPRGDILPSSWRQTQGEGLRYCAAVPLIMSAFKQYRDVKYEDWDWEDTKMKALVDAGFRDVLPFIHNTSSLRWTAEELLHIREEANVKGVGPVSQLSITVGPDMEFKKLPRLVKLLLCQVWCFNPSVYTPFIINNLDNLDEPTTPLVSSELNDLDLVVKPLVQKKDVKWGPRPAIDIPWDV